MATTEGVLSSINLYLKVAFFCQHIEAQLLEIKKVLKTFLKASEASYLSIKSSHFTKNRVLRTIF